jgi:acetyl-CoA carboxylase biotin carboxyl carrier protein
MRLKNRIKNLIELIDKSSVNEIEISSFWGAQKIRVSQNSQNIISQPVVNQVAPLPVEVKPQQSVEKVKEVEEVTSSSSGITITADLVGTYYSSPKPNTPQFVKVGDIITVGQTICIIEAMKIFNEIEAEVSGKVIKILVEDSSPVEFGQPLMIIESV